MGALLVVGCRRADPARMDAGAAPPPPSASIAPSPSAPPSAAAAVSAPPASSSPPVALLPLDAGACSCRLLYGPAQQKFTGEAALVPTASGLDLVTHHNGFPMVTSLAFPPGTKLGRTPIPDEPDRVTWPACTVAGADTFCVDASGAIQRTRAGGTTRVARTLPGSRVSAAVLGDGHVALAYLGPHRSSEGIVSQALVSVDDRPAMVLSEDGAGATFVTLAARGAEVLALYIDARMAMTPVHARTIGWSSTGPVLGKDAVIFVGGTPEPRTAGALGVSTTGAFGLIPIEGETGFGMAAVKIDVEPRDDEPTVWSRYPNGFDPAPLAATTTGATVHVARVRPLAAAPDAPRALELGRLDATGAFEAQCIVPSLGNVRGVAMAADAQGALYVLYTDAGGSWLERRSCP